MSPGKETQISLFYGHPTKILFEPCDQNCHKILRFTQPTKLCVFQRVQCSHALAEDRTHHLTVNICQPIAAALELVGEPLVVDTQQMQ